MGRNTIYVSIKDDFIRIFCGTPAHKWRFESEAWVGGVPSDWRTGLVELGGNAIGKGFGKLLLGFCIYNPFKLCWVNHKAEF
jgi:hypothetical protein